MDRNFELLLSHLGRKGQAQYYWRSSDKRSRWFPVGQPSTLREDASNYYFGVHPSRHAKSDTQRAEIKDIAAINCLFAEFDAKDHGDDKAATLALATSCAPSVVVDSGGGYHAYWLLEGPFVISSDDARRRAQRIQAGWVSLVGGDEGAKDLARVLRIPGTLNAKYDPPRVVSVTSAIWDRLYSLGIMEAMLPPPPVYSPPPAGPSTSGKYGQKALLTEMGMLAMARDGTRNDALFRSAAKLGELVSGGELSQHEAESNLLTVAVRIGLDEHEARNTIASGLKHGMEQPRRPAPKSQQRPTTRYNSGPVMWGRLT